MNRSWGKRSPGDKVMSLRIPGALEKIRELIEISKIW